MASEILGLFTSPQDYQMRQQQMARNEALQFAQLDPFQKASYGIYQGANQLAGAGARLLGGEDPQLRMISQRQMLSQEIDPADPESILRVARKAAQLNDQPFALQLSDYARKAQGDIAQTEQRTAAANRERQQALPPGVLTAQEKTRLEDMIKVLESLPQRTDEQQRGLDYAKSYLKNINLSARTDAKVREQQIAFDLSLGAGPEGSDAQVAKYRETLNKLTEKTTQEKLGEFERILNARYPENIPENAAKRAQLMDQFLTNEISGRKTGKGTQVSLGGINVDTGKAGEAAGKKLGEELVDVKGKQAALDSISDAKKLLGPNGQGIYAGAYSDFQKGAAKYLNLGSKDKVARTEEFVAYIGETVVPRLKEFGGNDSEQELKYLNDIMGGNIKMEPKALVRILTTAERKINRGIERLRAQAETGENKKPLTSTLPTAQETPLSTKPATPPKRVKFSDLPN